MGGGGGGGRTRWKVGGEGRAAHGMKLNVLTQSRKTDLVEPDVTVLCDERLNEKRSTVCSSVRHPFLKLRTCYPAVGR